MCKRSADACLSHCESDIALELSDLHFVCWFNVSPAVRFDLFSFQESAIA